MREIKFNVWDKMLLKMIINPDTYSTCSGNSKLFKNPSSNWIWLQYTDIKDKNGKEVYEGDILKLEVHFPSVIDDRTVLVVYRTEAHPKWGQRLMRYCLEDFRQYASVESGEWNEYKYANTPNDDHEMVRFLDQCEPYGIEIIGNIYENAELLMENVK
jgi:uncharacterized phage protein (TIGR01671 family)